MSENNNQEIYTYGQPEQVEQVEVEQVEAEQVEYVEQPYQQAGQQTYTAPGVIPGHGKAVASLICGIASYFCCGIFTAIAAIILAVMAKNEGNNEGIRKAGFILGIIACALSVIGIIVAIISGVLTANTYSTGVSTF